MANIETQIAIDGDETDSAYNDEDIASDTTSLKSAIVNYKYRNGRRYHAYKEGSYWGPNDETQADQLDIFHHISLLLLDGELNKAPISKNPTKVLDVGTGTGIWAIEFADKFPSAEVIGTDLSPTQPSLVPPNLRFEVDDFTEPWVFRRNSFDFIHARCLYGCVADWSAFYKEALDHLQPGGYFEQLEMSVWVKSDDGSVTPDSIFDQWGKISLTLGEKFGKSLQTVDESKAGIEAAGFINVVERRWKLPVGGWAADKQFKEIGQYNRIHWEQGIEGWCIYLLTSLLKWSLDDVHVYLAKMRQALRDRSIHAYQEV
ncbi:S-adenosyl-L-methionine-dependent methyltransferase [Cucurbitaria berberidis CBS 394.84]|uniref:S-adenosyl-L-methionine-dependent methyltransferase n=1 Tax=Cucurbitaria berberidis CBS 394.84 TaxID=1168544 RepID=A0A9P4GBN1_9PLEO|nr:S-adenosyl-L-methionine-dependent methyltransferase [Cucurbitaria berberidis CBS 394.84]KAF1842642.1 S-adenosyl-L-methionine-dependent methyltransferase [Cucurbitaria berberidis CBS 394.84]